MDHFSQKPPNSDETGPGARTTARVNKCSRGISLKSGGYFVLI